MERFVSRFPSERSCRAHWVKTRWPDGWQCPACGSAAGYTWRRGGVECADRACGCQTSCTAGTHLAWSHLALRTWYGAAWWYAAHVEAAHPASSRSLSRLLSMRHATAVRVLRKRRDAAGPPHADGGSWSYASPGRNAPPEAKERLRREYAFRKRFERDVGSAFDYLVRELCSSET